MFDRKQDIMNRLKAKRQMANYRANQAQINQPKQEKPSMLQTIGNGINNTVKAVNGVNSALDKIQALKSPLPSSVLSNHMTEGAGQLGNFGLPTSTPNLQTGELASKIGAGEGLGQLTGGTSALGGAGETAGALSKAGSTLGKAMPVVGGVMGGLEGASKLAQGNYVDGAMDLAKTGAMFIPGVGTAVAGAIQIAQMLKGAKDKAEQKAMQESQAEAQKGMSQAENATQQFQNNIAQTQQENNQKMQEQMQQNNQGYMGELPNLGVSDATDVNIPDTTQTPQEVASIPLENEQTIPQDNSSIVSNMLDAVQGKMTGGASDVKPLPAEGSASAELGQTDKYNQVAQPEVQTEGQPQVQTEGQTTKDEILNSVKNRLGTDTGNAFRDFFNGYQDNRNTSFMEGDLYNNLANGTIEPSKNEEGQLTGGASEVKKSIMNRLGEMAGTGARVLTNPAVQAGIAGLVTKATGGDNAEVAQNMVKYGFDKAKSNAYAKQMGLQPTILGNYDATDLKNYNDNNYHNKMADITQQHYNDQIKQKYAELEEKVRHNEATEAEQKEYHRLQVKLGQDRNNISRINANNNTRRTDAYIKTAQTKIDQIAKDKSTKDEMNSNLAKYYSILQSGDKAKIDKAKEGLLANYGTDFLGVLKNFDKLLEEDED